MRSEHVLAGKYGYARDVSKYEVLPQSSYSNTPTRIEHKFEIGNQALPRYPATVSTPSVSKMKLNQVAENTKDLKKRRNRLTESQKSFLEAHFA